MLSDTKKTHRHTTLAPEDLAIQVFLTESHCQPEDVVEFSLTEP